MLQCGGSEALGGAWCYCPVILVIPWGKRQKEPLEESLIPFVVSSVAAWGSLIVVSIVARLLWEFRRLGGDVVRCTITSLSPRGKPVDIYCIVL